MKPPAIRSLLWEVFLEVSPDHNGEAKALAYRKIKALDEEEAEKFMDYAFFLGATNMPSPTINVYGNVGNLNLGTQIGLIETSLNVTSKQGLDGSDFANALKKITDDVLASKELADEHKQEVVETLASFRRRGRRRCRLRPCRKGTNSPMRPTRGTPLPAVT